MGLNSKRTMCTSGMVADPEERDGEGAWSVIDKGLGSEKEKKPMTRTSYDY